LGRAFARAKPLVDCLVGKGRAREMVRHNLGLDFGAFGELRDERLSNARV
jgi:hypothetical protein